MDISKATVVKKETLECGCTEITYSWGNPTNVVETIPCIEHIEPNYLEEK